MIGRGPIHAVPEGVSRPRARRADVGVAVVAVDAPGVKDALEIDQLVAGTAEVIHDLLPAPLHEGLPDAARDVVEGLVPRHPLPRPAPARADPAQRMANPLGIVHLVQGGRALGAVAAAAARMRGVALELLDLEGLLVDVGEQPAGRLAVEADGRDQRIAALHLSGPGHRIVLDPVLPALHGGIARQAARARGQLAGGGVQRFGSGPCVHDPQLRGRDWPALTQRSS